MRNTETRTSRLRTERAFNADGSRTGAFHAYDRAKRSALSYGRLAAKAAGRLGADHPDAIRLAAKAAELRELWATYRNRIAL